MVLIGLDIFPSGKEITPAELLEAGLIRSLKQPVKILGNGDIHHPLSVKANKFSSAAQRKIVAAGGKAEKIGDAA